MTPMDIQPDAYDGIETLEDLLNGGDPDNGDSLRALVVAAKRAADLWNDPPSGLWANEAVRENFPQLAEALDELLGGGPTR